MLDFIANHFDAIVQAGSIVGGLILVGWHKLRGDKVEGFSTIVTGAIGSLMQEALDIWQPNGGTTLADGLAFVRDYAERQIWSVLEKRKVPRNSVTEALVHAAVEKGTDELGYLIRDKLATARMPAAVADLADKAAAIPPAISKAEAAGLAAGRAIFNEVAERADASEDVKP